MSANRNVPPSQIVAAPDYGYQGAGPTRPHDYLMPAVLEISRRLKVRRVLDLGCGNGELCRRLNNEGYEVVGCDPSESGIRIAQESVPGVRFSCCGVYDDPEGLDEAPFDLVISTEVIEHLYLPRKLPQFAKAVLRPGGYFVVSTPYHGYLKNLVISLSNKWDAHWCPSWDGGHIKFWSPDTLKSLVAAEGFSFEAFAGVGRVPWLWKSMILTFRS